MTGSVRRTRARVLPLGVKVGLALTAALAVTATLAPAPALASTSTPLLGWGGNGAGQVGDATTKMRSQPVAVTTGAATFTQIASGLRFSLALTADGQLMAWGDNSLGQLGLGTASAGSRVPVAVAMPDGAAVVAMAAGPSHALAVTALGDVYGWGQNDHGETGTGPVSPYVATPKPVSMPAGVTATAVAGGEGYSLALTSAGAVLVWGLNGHGQFGNGTTDKNVISTSPVFVSLPPGTVVTAIGAGDHSEALTSAGQVLSWGDNGGCQLGNGLVNAVGSPVPVSVLLPAGTTATAIADNTGHSFAVLSDGRVVGWGIDSAGQLGDGTTVRCRATPAFVQLPAGAQAVSLAAGGLDGFALTADGAIYAWGANSNGRLGDGTTINRPVPVAVALPAGVTATAIAAGGQHAMAITG